MNSNWDVELKVQDRAQAVIKRERLCISIMVFINQEFEKTTIFTMVRTSEPTLLQTLR